MQIEGGDQRAFVADHIADSFENVSIGITIEFGNHGAMQCEEHAIDRLGLLAEPIHLRLSGCPNGCSRPYLGEIALTGRAVGRYELRLGADFAGERMNACYLENADEAEILEALERLFTDFAARRNKGEHFGDFIARTGVVKPPPRRPDRLAVSAPIA